MILWGFNHPCLFVHDFATIHSMGVSFKMSSVCKPWFLPWFFLCFLWEKRSCHHPDFPWKLGGLGGAGQRLQANTSKAYIIYLYPHIVCVLLIGYTSDILIYITC